jgi:hypothetical protein
MVDITFVRSLAAGWQHGWQHGWQQVGSTDESTVGSNIVSRLAAVWQHGLHQDR